MQETIYHVCTEMRQSLTHDAQVDHAKKESQDAVFRIVPHDIITCSITVPDNAVNILSKAKLVIPMASKRN